MHRLQPPVLRCQFIWRKKCRAQKKRGFFRVCLSLSTELYKVQMFCQTTQRSKVMEGERLARTALYSRLTMHVFNGSREVSCQTNWLTRCSLLVQWPGTRLLEACLVHIMIYIQTSFNHLKALQRSTPLGPLVF